MTIEERLDFYKKQIDQTTRQLQRAENAKAYMENNCRKQRAHRLITRGAAFESLFPKAKKMTERQFFNLLSWLKDDDFVNEKIDELIELSLSAPAEKGGDS